ncbi:MAG: glycosyltransferase family 4 protein [Candidatus Saccharimonadales bacterium]
MKIGFVLDDSLDRGDGVQQYILTLGVWLSHNGHEVHYLVGETKNKSIPNVHPLSDNIGVRFNGNRMSIPLPADKSRITELLSREQFDVLHVQMPYSPMLAGKVIKNAPSGTVLVGTFHILPFGRLQALGAKLLAWWTRKSTAKLQKVWSVSEPAQAFALSLGIESQIMPNVIDLKRFKKATARPDSFTIAFLGRLVERKGCLELLKAAEVLFLNNMPVKVLIGGTGPQETMLKDWVAKRKMTEVVSFEGFIKEADKPNFLASATVAVFPSLGGESFGIVLLEAMAAGTQVVLGGNNPGYKSVMGSIPEALIDPRNTLDFVASLKRLYEDEPLRRRLHQKQQALVAQYDIGLVGKKLVSYYQAIKDKTL